MNTLIAFFSHKGETYFSSGYKILNKGNAQVIAEKFQSLLDAELFEIQTKKQYPVSYKACCDEALAEQKNGVFPELKTHLQSSKKYDNLVLVYPCWWETMPQAVFTFLKSYDFSNCNIFPVCTHEGSGMGRSESDIAEICPNSSVKKGLAIQGEKAPNSDSDIQNYLKSQNLI